MATEYIIVPRCRANWPDMLMNSAAVSNVCKNNEMTNNKQTDVGET